jgi:hypothetical protein
VRQAGIGCRSWSSLLVQRRGITAYHCACSVDAAAHELGCGHCQICQIAVGCNRGLRLAVIDAMCATGLSQRHWPNAFGIGSGAH